MVIKVYKPTPKCFDNVSVVFNATNPSSNMNKKKWRLATILLKIMLLTMIWR